MSPARRSDWRAMRIDNDVADRFVELTLGHLTRPWPYKLDQILTSETDLVTPQALHPIFHGSFDWHSCVHGWWQVMRLTRLFPGISSMPRVEGLASKMLTAGNIAGECACFERPMSEGFERPYGWAWLLALHDELSRRKDRPWAAIVTPLAARIAECFARYLPRLHYAIRSGKHDSTAFALVLALRWARNHDQALASLIEARSLHWFGGDRQVQVWEPSGEDFLSATLCEALLMREIQGDACVPWLHRFMPDPYGPATATLTTPVSVSDRTDGRLAHLDGLNLSRAWAWRMLAPLLPEPSRAEAIARTHLNAALPHLAEHYMGEHWLATFAVLALTDGTDPD